MKVTSSTLLVLATSGSALAGSWADWLPFKDATVTQTLTRTTQICPCNGEVRVTPAHAATKPVKPEDIHRYTVTGAIKPEYKQPLTVTKAGPIVVVFTTAGSLTTKTGVKLELKPTSGPVITKTVWTGPQPTDNLEWVDWDAEDDGNGGTLTRSHTKTVTVIGPAPTGTETEPWADWVAPTNTRTRSRTHSSASTSRGWGSSSSGVGPIPGSTTSHGWSHSTSTSSTSSSVGGPIDGTTSTSTSTLSTTTLTTTSSSSASIDPIDQSSSSSSSEAAVTSSSSSSADAVTSSSSSSEAAVTSSSSSSADAVTSSSSSSEDAVTSSSSSSSLIDVTTTTTAAPTTTTSTPPTQSTVIADVRNLDYITALLQQHNVHRTNHSAADLVWSTNLATIAAQTAATCVYAHDTVTGGGGYGQNIGAGYTPNQAGQMITNDMYNGEIGFYPGPYDTDNIDMTNFPQFGHFTQIVWKGTQNVGCATQFCPNGLVNAGFTNWFTVCNYGPPGNIRGAYANVGAPLGGPTVVVLANPN